MYSKTGNNYKSAGRRVISMVLAIALICSFGLTSVFAQDGASFRNSGTVDSGRVETEAELFIAINDGSIAKITLDASINLTKTLLIERPVTIDGNGKTINGVGNITGVTLQDGTTKRYHAVLIRGAYTVDISDLTIENAPKNGFGLMASSLDGLVGGPSPTVTLTDVNLNGNNGGGMLVRDSANVTVTGDMSLDKNLWGGIDVAANGKLDATNATLNFTAPSDAKGNYAVYYDGTKTQYDAAVKAGLSITVPTDYVEKEDKTNGKEKVYFEEVADVAIGFTALAANGETNKTDTTELKITLDKAVAGLTADDITLTGATKGALTSDAAPVYKLAISDITVADGDNVNVALAKTGFTFTPAHKDIAINKVAPPIVPIEVKIAIKTAPTATAIFIGEKLNSSTISGEVIEAGTTKLIEGSWGWNDSSTIVSATGSFDAIFTPTAVANTTFNPTKLTAKVNVIANEKGMDPSLEEAFNEAKEAVAKLIVTNDTTADSILSTVKAAMTNKHVTSKWTKNFAKVSATTEKTGLITGTIELALSGGNFADVIINKEIAKLPTPPVVNKKALTDAITAANTAKTGIVTSVNGTDVSKDKKWVTLAVNTAFDTAITAAQAVANKTTATQAEIDTAVTTLNTAKDVYVKAQALGTYTPSSSSGSGGSSSGGGSSTPPPSVDAPSSNVGGSGEVKSDDIKAETSKAVADAVKAAPGATANVTVKNADNITPTALKEMAAAATVAGGKAQLSADTVVNGVVETRLYINPALAATLKDSIKLGVSTNSLEIDATKAKFASFANNIAVASFAQQGSFGMKIQAAVKLDLTTLNTKTLVFYSYDKATNKYIPIVAPAYTIDKNGYLHFTTTVGGDIIITDKALIKK